MEKLLKTITSLEKDIQQWERDKKHYKLQSEWASIYQKMCLRLEVMKECAGIVNIEAEEALFLLIDTQDYTVRYEHTQKEIKMNTEGYYEVFDGPFANSDSKIYKTQRNAYKNLTE